MGCAGSVVLKQKERDKKNEQVKQKRRIEKRNGGKEVGGGVCQEKSWAMSFLCRAVSFYNKHCDISAMQVNYDPLPPTHIFPNLVIFYFKMRL